MTSDLPGARHRGAADALDDRLTMIYTFTVNERLPGLNEIVNSARGNRYMGAAQKKTYTQSCQWWIKLAKLKPITCPVKVHFDWYEPNFKRDPDNIRAGAKFILDALVEAGILQTDGRKWVHGLSDSYYSTTPKNGKVNVTIEEVQ